METPVTKSSQTTPKKSTPQHTFVVSYLYFDLLFLFIYLILYIELTKDVCDTISAQITSQFQNIISNGILIIVFWYFSNFHLVMKIDNVKSTKKINHTHRTYGYVE